MSQLIVWQWKTELERYVKEQPILVMEKRPNLETLPFTLHIFHPITAEVLSNSRHNQSNGYNLISKDDVSDEGKLLINTILADTKCRN